MWLKRPPSYNRWEEGAHLSHSVLHHLLVRHIALVAYEQLVDALSCIAVDLLQPLLDVVERVHIGHIVDNANTVGATVVRGRDGTETLLAGSIPLIQAAHVSGEKFVI